MKQKKKEQLREKYVKQISQRARSKASNESHISGQQNTAVFSLPSGVFSVPMNLPGMNSPKAYSNQVYSPTNYLQQNPPILTSDIRIQEG